MKINGLRKILEIVRRRLIYKDYFVFTRLNPRLRHTLETGAPEIALPVQSIPIEV